MTNPTDPEGTPMTDRPPRRLSRRRDCDPVTREALRRLEDHGVLFDIVETSDRETILRLRRPELERLAGMTPGPVSISNDALRVGTRRAAQQRRERDDAA